MSSATMAEMRRRTAPGVRHDFDALFREHATGVARTMYAFTAGRRGIAEEATAEAFAQAIAHAGSIREPVGWIYRTAFRLAAAELRRERRPVPELEHAESVSTGITLTEAAAPTSPAPEFPDVLVMRCEGLGPAVDADTVRLHPDGLHIEATNVADAVVIALDPEDGTIEAILHPFETVTERLVVAVPAGQLWIGCRVLNEQGEVEGGPDEVPQAYVSVTVLPPEGS